MRNTCRPAALPEKLSAIRVTLRTLPSYPLTERLQTLTGAGGLARDDPAWAPAGSPRCPPNRSRGPSGRTLSRTTALGPGSPAGRHRTARPRV